MYCRAKSKGSVCLLYKSADTAEVVKLFSKFSASTTSSDSQLPVSENCSELSHILSIAKWNESGFRPPLCTYRLNWARRTSWGWWDDWDDTVLQTQDSKFEPWRSEAEHTTSRSRRLPTILTFTRGWGRNIFVSFKPSRPGTEPRTTAVLTTTLGPPPPINCTNLRYLSLLENDYTSGIKPHKYHYTVLQT